MRSTVGAHFFSLESKEVITRPEPIPMRIDATKNRADVLRNMNPTPIPISVVPPMTHVLLSSFLFILISSFNSFSFCYNIIKYITFQFTSASGETGQLDDSVEERINFFLSKKNEKWRWRPILTKVSQEQT